MTKILVVTKQSKYEWERDKFGLDDAAIRAKYSSEHANLGAILEAHERQLATRGELHTLLPDATFVSMDGITDIIQDYDLVVSLGGDNSFIYVTHYLSNIPVVGINSDPARSTGALCAWNSIDLKKVVEQLQQSHYRTEEWTRLQTSIDGKPFTLATSEYFFGEEQRDQMSRHSIVYRGQTYEEKNSGILVSTGAGSTGWYRSAGGSPFPKTETSAAFRMTEPYIPPEGRAHSLHGGELKPGEELVLYSLNDSGGRVSADSWEKRPFIRGSRAVVRISDQPLRVIVPT